MNPTQDLTALALAVSSSNTDVNPFEEDLDLISYEACLITSRRHLLPYRRYGADVVRLVDSRK